MAQNDGPAILVVEDDAALRGLIVRMLEAGGFPVASAGKATEGLEIVRNMGGALQLAIIDMMMPGVSGLDLATDLQREFPDLGILYISGYVDSVAADVLQRRTPEHVLLKPFSEKTLLERIQLLIQPLSKPSKGAPLGPPLRSSTQG